VDGRDDQVVAVAYGELCALYVIDRSTVTRSRRATSRDRFVRGADHDHQPPRCPTPTAYPRTARNALTCSSITETSAPRSDEADPELAADDARRRKRRLPRASRRVDHAFRLQRTVTPSRRDDTIDDHGAGELVRRSTRAARHGRRLLEHLSSRELIELARQTSTRSAISSRLLQAHGTEAQDRLRSRRRLANEIGAARGIWKLFATGIFQIALRCSRGAV
jgi:hypothetical protein